MVHNVHKDQFYGIPCITDIYALYASAFLSFFVIIGLMTVHWDGN